jgi:hypothetical protein
MFRLRNVGLFVLPSSPWTMVQYTNKDRSAGCILRNAAGVFRLPHPRGNSPIQSLEPDRRSYRNLQIVVRSIGPEYFVAHIEP